MPENIIETENLTKRYPGGATAVDNLNLKIKEGEVYGLLGPNGSGKTTTILMITGLTEPTGGTVNVAGFNPLREALKVKRIVAYMPDSVGFYNELSAFDNLDYTGQLAGIPFKERNDRIEKAIERMGIGHVAYKPVKTFSRGMRQRLALAEVIMKKPRIAILDEPTQGLDPESAHEFLQLIKSLQKDGITILLSSHLLDQVQQICDRVGLFYKGKLILEGSVGELSEKVMGKQIKIELTAETDYPDNFRKKLENIPEITDFKIDSNRLDEVYRTYLAKERQNAEQ